jgi:competence protein ComEA
MEPVDPSAPQPADARGGDPLGGLRPPPVQTRRERAVAVLDILGVSGGRAVAGGVVAIAALAACVWLLRPPSPPVEDSLPIAKAPAASVTTATTAPATVVVDVAGAVSRPGVIELDAGSRVVDAIAAAGGVTAKADVARLNLAAVLVDGERVYVPVVGEAIPVPVGGTGDASSGGSTPAGPVNLNTATAEELDALPGVGPTTAQAIIEWRSQHGGFSSVDQLLEVRGIGEAKLADLRDLVTV